MGDLPKYVWLANSALRLRGEQYWRDGGDWGVRYKIKDGVLLSSSPMNSVNNVPLIECTEQEWRTDNGQYAP